jgi:hypothetical protein
MSENRDFTKYFLEKSETIWLDSDHTRFTWVAVRPWREDPDFSEAENQENEG